MKQFSIGLMLFVGVLSCGESSEARTEAEETGTEAEETGTEAEAARTEAEAARELEAARRRKVAVDITSIEAALTSYFLMTGSYPDDLEALVEKDANGYRLLATATVPRDPWGNEYIYEKPNPREDLDVISYGGDGQPGGEGDDADSTLIELRSR